MTMQIAKNHVCQRVKGLLFVEAYAHRNGRPALFQIFQVQGCSPRKMPALNLRKMYSMFIR